MRPVGLTIVPAPMQPLVWVILLALVWAGASRVPPQPRGTPDAAAGPAQITVPRTTPVPNPAVVDLRTGAEVPLLSLLPEGRAGVILVLVPGCRACYPMVSRLAQTAAAEGGAVGTLLLVTGSTVASVLDREAREIASEFQYSGPIALDPGMAATEQLGDRPLRHPYCLGLTPTRRLVCYAGGRVPEPRLLARSLAALDQAPERREAALADLGASRPLPQGLMSGTRPLRAAPSEPGLAPTPDLLLVGAEMSPTVTDPVAEFASLPDDCTPDGRALVARRARPDSDEEQALQHISDISGVPAIVVCDGALDALLRGPRPNALPLLIVTRRSPDGDRALILSQQVADLWWIARELAQPSREGGVATSQREP